MELKFVQQLTAQRRNRGVDWLDEHALAVKLQDEKLAHAQINLTLPTKRSMVWTYLFAALRIEQDPAELDDLCRIFGHIDTVLITGRGHMDDDVSVQIGLLTLRVRRHDVLSR